MWPAAYTPIQSEAELQRERAELKAWRKRKVETLAARRRRARPTRNLTSPPNARIGRKRHKALVEGPRRDAVAADGRRCRDAGRPQPALTTRRRPRYDGGRPRTALATEVSQEARIFTIFSWSGYPVVSWSIPTSPSARAIAEGAAPPVADGRADASRGDRGPLPACRSQSVRGAVAEVEGRAL